MRIRKVTDEIRLVVGAPSQATLWVNLYVVKEEAREEAVEGQ